MTRSAATLHGYVARPKTSHLASESAPMPNHRDGASTSKGNTSQRPQPKHRPVVKRASWKLTGAVRFGPVARTSDRHQSGSVGVYWNEQSCMKYIGSWHSAGVWLGMIVGITGAIFGQTPTRL